jgi:hypothetical protein
VWRKETLHEWKSKTHECGTFPKGAASTFLSDRHPLKGPTHGRVKWKSFPKERKGADSGKYRSVNEFPKETLNCPQSKPQYWKSRSWGSKKIKNTPEENSQEKVCFLSCSNFSSIKGL